MAVAWSSCAVELLLLMFLLLLLLLSATSTVQRPRLKARLRPRLKARLRLRHARAGAAPVPHEPPESWRRQGRG